MAYGTAGTKNVSLYLTALDAGYRHLDTALIYGNHREVGEAIRRSDLPRDAVFLTTKVSFFPGDLYTPWHWLLDAVGFGWGISKLAGKGSERAAIRRSLEELGLEQVDLCLLHSPMAAGMSEFLAMYLPHRLGRHKPVSWQRLRSLQSLVRTLLHSLASAVGSSGDQCTEARMRAWRDLEEAQKAGECRYIGVSNYDMPLLKEIEAGAGVLPAVNQIEMHPRFQARETVEYCRLHGIAIMSYGNGLSLHLEAARQIADRHGLSPAQVTLRWALQHGAAAVAKSSRAAGMAQNLEVLKFTLSPEEMQVLDAADEGQPFYWDAQQAGRQRSTSESAGTHLDL
eukprot:gnl/TRDRNA2_/TRDRNA2_74891_c0_seq1.p1 gnl/TRDRNA2_/TRDRNA2_74891_c0~~gnl/TRDRNA2_/TRDRNA2_74891_c0_seq1.p1  ORF type:complete len:367 (+),score=54.71 gnl/TRDRNA2_/TRDRNA2_74891_c0_seq1:84-1103(+)